MSKVDVFFARERMDSAGTPLGVWDYVCEQNDGKVGVAGYCRGWDEKPLSWFEERYNPVAAKRYHAAQEALRPFKAKFHSDGHRTREEACRCFRGYRLDQEMSFIPLGPEARRAGVSCQVCHAPASFHTEFIGGGGVFSLCWPHATREMMEEIYPLDCPPQHIVFY